MLFTFTFNNVSITIVADSYEEAKKEAEKMNRIVKA